VTSPFEAPNAVDTGANNVNPQGTISGVYYDSTFVEHGYQRSASGGFFELSVPGSSGTGDNFSNSKGQITGVYLDANGANHGFVYE